MIFPENALSQKLGTSIPLWQAPLPFGIVPTSISGEISASGALGMIRVGETERCAELEKTVDDYLKHHNKPALCFMHRLPKHTHFSPHSQHLSDLATQYQLPYPLPSADHFLDLLEMAISANPRIIGFANGIPEKDTITFIKEQNILTFAVVKNILEALTAEDFGIDALVLQGIEAGGEQCGFDNNLPNLQLPALSLLQQIRSHTALPLILWSDYTHGADIVAAIIAGAHAVMLDRPFVQCALPNSHIAHYHEYQSQVNAHYTIRPMRYVNTPNVQPLYLPNVTPAERESLITTYLKQHPEETPYPISASANQLPTTLPELFAEIQSQARALIG